MARRRGSNDIPLTILKQLMRRKLTRQTVVVAIALIVISVILDRMGTFRPRGSDWDAYDQKTVTVTRVVDGDTVRIRLSPGAEEETIRLLGIDAPEISHGKNQPADHFGPEATQQLETWIEGKPVTLRLDSTQTRDKYQRLLAYINVGGSENINLSLVRDGLAYAHRIYPHSLQRQFEQAEDDARGKHRGLWDDVKESEMPAWRQHWLEDKKSGTSRKK